MHGSHISEYCDLAESKYSQVIKKKKISFWFWKYFIEGIIIFFDKRLSEYIIFFINVENLMEG